MRLPSLSLFVAAFLSLPLIACATPGGRFGADGFHDPEFPIAVRYSAPQSKDFLGPDWRVDNFYVGEDGSIGAPKSTKGYEGPQAIDVKGDGVLQRRDAPYFDLKLDNRKTSAVIWVQTLPLDAKDGERNLKNLVEEYADNLSGTGFFAAVNDGKTIKVKTYAAKIAQGGETTLGGLAAYDARLDLANLDQVRLDPNARTAVIRVVIAKTDYLERIEDEYSRLDARTLVRVGYSASPSDFEAGLPDFERFLKLLEFGPAKGPYTGARFH